MAPGIAHQRCGASVVPDPRRRCGTGEVPPACAGVGVPGVWNGDDGMEVLRAVTPADRSVTANAQLRAHARTTSHFGPPMHPEAGGVRPFFTGVEYCAYAPSSRLANRAPRRPKTGTYSSADPQVRATRITLAICALDGAGRLRLLVGYTDREGQGRVDGWQERHAGSSDMGDRVGEKSAIPDRRCQRISCNAGTQSGAPTP